MTTTKAGSVGSDQIPRRAWIALAVSTAGYVLASWNTTATNIAFGAIGESFPEASQGTVSWVASIFFIGLASLLLISGRLADRVGRRKIFRAGLVVFGVASVAAAAAPSIWVLIAARFGQAVGGALVTPAALPMVLPEFPTDRHATAVAIWTGAGPLASIIAPSLSAFLLGVTIDQPIDMASWRLLFLISAVVAFGAYVASFGPLQESKSLGTSGPLDWLGVVFGTGAIGLLVFATSQGSEWGWTRPAIVASLAASPVLLALFIERSRRHPEPLLDIGVFLRKSVWSANVASAFLNVVGLAAWLVWPLYMTRIWDLSTTSIGLALTTGPVGAGLGTTMAGRLVERYGHKRAASVGSLFPLAAMVWGFAFLGPEPRVVVGIVPAMILFGFGWGVTFPTLNSGVLASAPAELGAEVNAAFNTVRNVAAALGIAISIAILGAADRPDALEAFERVFLLFVAATLLCSLATFLLYDPTAE